jgi:hypothetical protein
VRGWRVITILIAIAGAMPRASAEDARTPLPLVLADYRPLPQVIFRGPTFDALLAVAEPTLVNRQTLIWVDSAAGQNLKFIVGDPKWVTIADGTRCWAILESEKPGQLLAADEIREASRHEFELVPAKPEYRDGSVGGDYAMRIAASHDLDIYELGVEFSSSGSGHVIEGRRLYISHAAGGGWRFLGEGPQELRGRNGMSDYYCNSTSAKVRFESDGKPVISFDAIHQQIPMWEGAKPNFPPVLEVHYFSTIHEPTQRAASTSPPCIICDHELNSLDAISDAIVYWTINDRAHLPGDARIVRACRGWLIKHNPALPPGKLKNGTQVLIPTTIDEVAEVRSLAR